MKEELPKNITEKISIANKVLEQLVFDKFNITFEIETHYSGYWDKWVIRIMVDVDVDRYCDFTSKYDYAYEKHMDNLERNVENALAYVDLKGAFDGLLLYYVNDYETEQIFTNLNEKLYTELENKFNVGRSDIENSDIYYYLYKSELEYVYFKTEFVGNEIEVEDEQTGKMSTIVTCYELYQIMNKVYEESGIDLHSESFVCN